MAEDFPISTDNRRIINKSCNIICDDGDYFALVGINQPAFQVLICGCTFDGSISLKADVPILLSTPGKFVEIPANTDLSFGANAIIGVKKRDGEDSFYVSSNYEKIHY